MYKQTALFSNSVLVFSLIILTFIGNVIPGVDYLIKYVNEFGILKYFIYFLFIVFFPSFLLFPLSFWLFKTKNLFWLIHYIIEYALYIFFIICCVYFYVCISRHNNGELGIVFFIGCFEIIGAIFTAKSFSDITNQNVKKPSLISKEQTQSTNESSMQFLVVKPKISFKDVSGMNPLKARLMEIATEHKALGKNGVLLSGDPGNGKTTMAEAVAGEMKYNFMPISISDFNAKWIGQTGEQLQEVFRCAIKNAPCVLFFDEADSFLTSREAMLEGGAANSENLKVANTFMTNINNMQGNRGVS